MPISVASLYGPHTINACLCGKTVQLTSLSGLGVQLLVPAQHHTAAIPASQPMQHHFGMPACRETDSFTHEYLLRRGTSLQFQGTPPGSRCAARLEDSKLC